MAAVGFEVRASGPFDGGRAFGSVGPYERVDGRLSFAVDPAHPENAAIVDLDLAPVDDDGSVNFHSDVVMLLPADPARGNGRAVLEAVNRGQPLSPRVINRAPYGGPSTAQVDPGDGFLFRHGYTVLYLGWQWDVIREGGRLGLDAPEARIDGAPIAGTTVIEIRPSWRQTTRLLANRAHCPYRAADVDDPGARLTVRDWDDGPAVVIPRDRWGFAEETPDGVMPSDEQVHFPDGFEAGKQYHLTYTTRGAPVVGVGLLAVRDTASFLRSVHPDNPAAGSVDRVYGFGMSQAGRLLRHYLYLGLNRDEAGSQAYDGLLPHVAGARRGEFNHRFAQPSVQLYPNFGHLPPFTDDPRTDPFSGVTDGLLRRQRQVGAVPKVVYLNTGAEYWRGDCSLMHTDGLAEVDVDPPDEVRHYHLAGTQHFPGDVPQVDYNEHDGARGRYGFNTVDLGPLVRAALVNLDRWVVEGVAPPPNAVPRIDDGTAVPREAVIDALRPVVDGPLPDPSELPVLREVDLGPDVERGIGRYPVVEGRTYPCLVAAVDADGNEVAGIRLPDVTVPLGTHTGFNPRHPETGAPGQIVSMQGFTRFFARTEQERLERGDPRASLEERYGDRDGFLARVRDAAQELVAAGHLLDEDVATVLEDAAARWDYVADGAPLDTSAWLRAGAASA